MKEDISANLMELRGQIAEACEQCDRDANDITIVAVSKTHSAQAIRIAVATGLTDIGENRIQEAEPKLTEVGHIARFHLIGHLQTNKVKKALALFDVIQSVDSLHLAEEISRHAGEIDRVVECYVEVNTSGEESKYGVAPDQALDLVREVNSLPHIDLTGLMTVGPLTDDQDRVHEAFRLCRDLFKQSRKIAGERFTNLSMGMSDDFRAAIAEGATMVRIGTAIFGPRER